MRACLLVLLRCSGSAFAGDDVRFARFIFENPTAALFAQKICLKSRLL